MNIVKIAKQRYLLLWREMICIETKTKIQYMEDWMFTKRGICNVETKQ